tara:strand:- start:107 stop:436 length:330 start_codon:yes stop_codon:yes gene_type:complete
MKKETREHPPPYISGYKLDIKNDDESKFVALHVGIYWSLGVFIIKNGDTLNVMCDSKKMYDILRTKCKTPDEIINDKIKFINDLLERRKLVVNYHLIDSNKNPASDLIR